MQFDYLAKRAALTCLVLISLLAGGCVRNTNPILKDDQVTSNDALLGKWVGADGKGSAELHPGQDGKYKLTYTNQDGKTGNFLVRFGKLGDLSVAEISPDELSDAVSDEYKSLLMPMYTMIIVEKTKPRLELTSISIDWLKKYLKDHPGELAMTDPDALVVQASTDDFQKFFIKHCKDEGMLGDAAVFVHPGDPTTQPAK